MKIETKHPALTLRLQRQRSFPCLRGASFSSIEGATSGNAQRTSTIMILSWTFQLRFKTSSQLRMAQAASFGIHFVIWQRFRVIFAGCLSWEYKIWVHTLAGLGGLVCKVLIKNTYLESTSLNQFHVIWTIHHVLSITEHSDLVYDLRETRRH